jgi:hypothetical protein
MRTPRWVGLVLFTVLLLHAVIAKLPYGLLPEMFFACHVATFIVGIGCLLQRRSLVLFGFSFHIGAGLWGYIFDLIDTRTTTWTSVLVHLLPLAVGFYEVRRAPMPRWAPLASFVFLFSMVVLAYFVTPPALNINLAHKPWPPVARLMPGLWSTWVMNLAFGLFLIVSSHWMIGRWVSRPASSGDGERRELHHGG